MDQNDTLKIAILDSGAGALPIFERLQQGQPHIPLIWICDNRARPYGNKPESTLKARVLKLIQQTQEKHHLSLIVIACNTASTVVLDYIRSHVTVPVVGVVPALKPAASITKNNRIGLLATPATINRPYIDDLIGKYAPHCQVIRWGSTELVNLAEDKLLGLKPDLSKIKEIIKPLLTTKGGEPDTIVLGCTHFPLLISEFKAVTSDEISWVDSCDAIYQRILSLRPTSRTTEDPPSSNYVIFTKRITIDESYRRVFDKYRITNYEFLPPS